MSPERMNTKTIASMHPCRAQEFPGEPRKNVDDDAATASMRPCRAMEASPEKKTMMMMWIATQT